LNTYQEFVLTFQSAWNLAGQTEKRWSQSFYVSGTITHSAADAEAAALALAGPSLALARASTSLIGWTYYDTGATTASQEKTYAPATHPGSGSAYVATGAAEQQLEVAAVAHCPVGVNTKGKEVYLRKYFHDVLAENSDPNTLRSLTNPSTFLDVFNHGAGPHNVVPVSPSKGTEGGPWTMETHLFTHQMRRGKKHKKVMVSTSIFDEIAQEIGQAAAARILIDAGKAAIAG
jgi:hypothetical protein